MKIVGGIEGWEATSAALRYARGEAVPSAPGSAAAALWEEAEDPDTLIAGTRGHGGLAGVIMGSVSHQLANLLLQSLPI